ncbi:hypothetical protein H696_06181, partial [Fonticula alba]
MDSTDGQCIYQSSDFCSRELSLEQLERVRRSSAYARPGQTFNPFNPFGGAGPGMLGLGPGPGPGPASPVAVTPPPQDMEYIDLALNPETHTKYEGEAAHRIWRTMYQQHVSRPLARSNAVAAAAAAAAAPSGHGEQPALVAAAEAAVADPSSFSDLDLKSLCPERHALYRIISGMHASVSAHLSARHSSGSGPL